MEHVDTPTLLEVDEAGIVAVSETVEGVVAADVTAVIAGVAVEVAVAQFLIYIYIYIYTLYNRSNHLGGSIRNQPRRCVSPPASGTVVQ